MLRLIIVDDEYLLRQLIRNIIDWKALDIEVVGEMASAELAMRQLESLKPDIILTDICMPDIDGLTFAEKIKGRNPDTKVIAITGYDNFEYAKRGICIGLDGYILKPINEEELTECIVKIKKKILEENRKRNEIETLSIFKREAEEIVKNYYLTKLLESDVPEKIVNSQLMEELALETSPMVWIVVFQWKTNLIAKRTGNEELLDCEMWIVNYCKEKLKKMVWVHGTANRLIILDPEKDIMPETILKQLQEEWKKEFECPLYYGTEVIYNQEKSIHEGYIEAVNQLNIELVNGENKPEDIWRWKQQKKETKQLWDLNELKRLQYCVEAEDLEEVEKVIDSYFLKWKDVTLGVLMCNQSLFDEYGLEIPKTMDDLYAVSATFNENGITPIAMGEKDKWPGLFPFGALALRYGGVEKTITMLNGEGNFDQEFVQKTAEELQKMVDEGVFASDSVALTDDEATEEFRQGRAAMWYSGNWKVDLLCEEGSPLEGKLTMVNWPAVSGADGDQNSFVGGASATLVASATSAHKKEAVEFMTFMSEHFSNYAYEEGAILPTWKYSGDMELKPFQQTLLDLMQGADGFCLAWDTLLDPETADVHSTSLQGIYAQQMTADDYVEAMAATR